MILNALRQSAKLCLFRLYFTELPAYRTTQYAKSIRLGICKVNFATELRIAYSDGVKKYLAENPDGFDPKKYGAAGMENVTALVKEKISVCGSEGQA